MLLSFFPSALTLCSRSRVLVETTRKRRPAALTPSAGSRSAKRPHPPFKDESRKIDSHGGPDSNANHNKIESPGKKYREQDGSK